MNEVWMVGLLCVAVAFVALLWVTSAIRRAVDRIVFLRLAATRLDVEQTLLEQPLLSAVFDENDDLRSRDRTSRLKLVVYARMYLELFQAADEVTAGWALPGTRRRRVARRWEDETRDALARSTLMQRLLRDDGARYGDRLRGILEPEREPGADRSETEP